MNLLKRPRLFATSIAFVLSLLTINTYAASNNDSDNAELANKCRELALKIDWLSRYQDRPTCTQNLDGTPIYFAGHYLDKTNKIKAEELLEEALVRLSFSFEVGCYGQDDIKSLISDIKVLLQAINAT
ncbi:MAG: hypothetical protein P1U36_09680 [Legionellaceae bacterium]|nr:hypothetical protein [Legionellaceae bacterium]